MTLAIAAKISGEPTVLVPAHTHSVRKDVVGLIMASIKEVDGSVVVTEPHLSKAAVRQASARSLPSWRQAIAGKLRQVFRQIDDQAELAKTASITAIVPAHNEEKDIAKTLASLLMQTRPIDRILVIINGSTDKTVNIVKMFADAFPDQIAYEVNPSYETRSGIVKEVRSKVGALNFAWRKYIVSRPREEDVHEYVLSLDADVVFADNVVEKLEQTLIDDIDDEKIGGVRAGYGFHIPKDAPLRERLLLAGQAHDFAGAELRDQLRRGNTVSILGGQATLFRREALEKVHTLTKGEGPWYAGSLVEDAYLTRQLERVGYKGVINPKARVMVGAMSTMHAWWNQRRKWQNGHVIDICSDKHFALDRIRWGQQAAMAFNWLLRVMFFTLLTLSLVAHSFVFNAWWTAPIFIAALQGFLTARKMVDRNNWLVLRAATFVLPEIYVWKTLAVAVVSTGKAIKAFFNSGKLDQSDWIKQANAESSKKVGSIAMWVTIIASVLIPMTIMMAVGYIFPQSVAMTLTAGWLILAGMSIISSTFGLIKIVRILKNGRRLSL